MYKKITTTTVEEYSDHSPMEVKDHEACIRTDVPLMTKIVEYVQKNPSTDLAALTNNMLEKSGPDHVLTLDDYESIINSRSTM